MEVFWAGPSSLNKSCVRQILRHPDQDTETLRRGTWRHLIMEKWLILLVELGRKVQGQMVDATLKAAAARPDLAQEFEAEDTDLRWGISQAIETIGVPPPGDIVSIEMAFLRLEIPEANRCIVRGESGVQVLLADGLGLRSGGMDLTYYWTDSDGDRWLRIVDWKGMPQEVYWQLVAYSIIAWRIGWLDGCVGVMAEARGLVFPWRSDLVAIGLDDLPEMARAVVAKLQDLKNQDLLEHPPETLNEYCGNCELAENCRALAAIDVHKSTKSYFDRPIKDVAMRELEAKRKELAAAGKALTGLAGRIKAIEEERIISNRGEGYGIKEKAAAYDGRDETAYRDALARHGIPVTVAERFDFTAAEKALKQRALDAGISFDVDELLKELRGNPSRYTKEIIKLPV